MDINRPIKRLKLSQLPQIQKTTKYSLPPQLIVKILSYLSNPETLEEFLENFPKYTNLIEENNIEDRVQRNFIQNTPCPGCRYKSPGQRDHMEYPNGCLSSSSIEHLLSGESDQWTNSL